MTTHNPKRPYLLTVKDNISLTPGMRRIVLAGDSLSGFPEVSPSSYVKLMFDRYGDALAALPEPQEKVLMRTYTVRKIDRARCELHIDMALHGGGLENGPASHWARHAQPGSGICVGGPGLGKPLNPDHDWVVFAGDTTSLPAIANYLEMLSPDTRGYALIAVDNDSDIQALPHPSEVELHWLVNVSADTFSAKVELLPPLPGTPAYWVAAEFSMMRALRSLITGRLKIPREHSYISSYWRQGRAEDQHKVDKKADIEAFEAAFAKG